MTELPPAAPVSLNLTALEDPAERSCCRLSALAPLPLKGFSCVESQCSALAVLSVKQGSVREAPTQPELKRLSKRISFLTDSTGLSSASAISMRGSHSILMIALRVDLVELYPGEFSG
jgi:hypothetical protein